MTGPALRLARDLLETLQGWTPLDADQRALADEYRAFALRRGAAAVERDLGRAHLTASAFVLTPDLRDVQMADVKVRKAV